MAATAKMPKNREKLLKGFRCPNECGRLEVIETRQASKGKIVRRRCCPVCNYRITTEEAARK